MKSNLEASNPILSKLDRLGSPMLAFVTLLSVLLLLLGKMTDASAAANLALNKPAVSSSSFSSSFSPQTIFDGNAKTYWASAFSDPQWVYVDLGNYYSITQVNLKWRTYATAYKIQVSFDASTWTDIYSTTAGVGGTESLSGLKGNARYVRLYGISRSSIYAYSLWEMEVYGNALPSGGLISLQNPGPQNGIMGALYTLQINASNSLGGLIIYSATGLPPGLKIDPTSGLISGVAPNAPANYTVTISADSNSGSIAKQTFSLAFLADISSSNLALNKPAVASSTFSSSFSPKSAFDGMANTYWVSPFSDPQWIYVDLGASYSINRVKIRWRGDYANYGTYASAYKIQVSPDASTWTDIYSNSNSMGGIEDLTGLQGTGRYVRMYGISRSSIYAYGIHEMEVYGKSLPKVLESRNDWYRTGANSLEKTLNTSNVNVNTFGLLYSYDVDGDIYAQPLYVPNVNTPMGIRNVLYVATQNDIAYAFDADSNQTLWVRDFKTSPVQGVIITPVPKGGQGDRGLLGIQSTPVIDAVSQTMYVVVRTVEKSLNKTSYIQRLHALDLSTGIDKVNPVVISATYKGVVFNPEVNTQRPGLALVNGQVIISWGLADKLGNRAITHGWVMSYDASSLRQNAAFATTTTPNGGGGLWASGRAPAVTNDGNVITFTGNGNPIGATSDGYDGLNNFSEAVLRLDPSNGLALVDWFTPENWMFLDKWDTDLGGSGPAILPRSNYIIGGGKEGIMYVIDPNNMGKLQAGNPHLIQSFRSVPANAAGWNHIMGGPVIWDRSSAGGPLTIYHWGESDYLRSYDFNGQTFDTQNAKRGRFYINQHPGGILSLSSNGAQSGTGIVWALGSQLGNAVSASKQGILLAYDASDVSKPVLWTSRMENVDDSMAFAKFTPPTIANGKVYVATFSNKLLVYGLLPTPREQHNYVKLVSRVGNKVLEVAGASRVAGARIQINQESNLGRQIWESIPLPNGAFQFKSVFSNMALDAGLGQNPGSQVQTWDITNTDSQVWMAIPTDSGYVKLVSQNNQLALDIASGNGADGSAVLVDTQVNGDITQDWKIVASSGENGPTRSAGITECDTTAVRIQSYFTTANTFMGLASDATSVWTDVPNYNNNSQTWNLYVPLDGHYRLQSVSNNYLLDIADGGLNDGSPVITAQSNGNLSQHWMINKNSTGINEFWEGVRINSVVAGKGLTATIGKKMAITVSSPVPANASYQAWHIQDTRALWCQP